jgi:hypothetical protein
MALHVAVYRKLLSTANFRTAAVFRKLLSTANFRTASMLSTMTTANDLRLRHKNVPEVAPACAILWLHPIAASPASLLGCG